MLLHLENGDCSAGWKTRHINDMAHTSTGAEKLNIQSQFDWFMAGVPRPAPYASDYDSASQRWNCPICPKTYSTEPDLKEHLATQSCSRDYPKDLSCPQCPQTFTRMNSMFQHVETPRCEASYENKVIADLLKHLKQCLEMCSPQELVGRDLYELKRSCSDGELLVTITDADASSVSEYHFGSGEFNWTMTGHSNRPVYHFKSDKFNLILKALKGRIY